MIGLNSQKNQFYKKKLEDQLSYEWKRSTLTYSK